MKNVIQITPFAGTRGGRWNPAKVKYKDGHTYCCLRSLRAVKIENLRPSDDPISQYITADGNSPLFTFNFDDASNDIPNKEIAFFADVIKYDSMMYTEGFKNPRQGAVTLFQYENLALNDKRNFRNELLMLTAKNKAHNMSYPEKINAYYYYGENPMVQTETGVAAIDHMQLSIRMWADNVGVVLRRSPFGNTGKTYVEHFVEDYKANDETYVLKTNVLKALILKDGNFIPLLTKNGAAFVFGKDTIGSNIDECVAWLNNNPERKKFLLDMVKQSDVIGVDNLDEAMLEPEKENVAEDLQEKESEDAIRQEAKKLRVRFWHEPNKIEDVKKALEGARPIWAQVKSLGLQNKVDQMKKPTLENIAALVEKEKVRLMELV